MKENTEVHEEALEKGVVSSPVSRGDTPHPKGKSKVWLWLLLLVLLAGGAYGYFGYVHQGVSMSEEVESATPGEAEADQAREAAAAAERAAAAEYSAWELAQEIHSEKAYESFLSTYPESGHAGTARERKSTLEAAAKQAREAAVRDPYGIWETMVYVEGGNFQMGCTSEQSDCGSDERPVHQVSVSSFRMSKYEITQTQWKAVMGSNPSHFKGDNLPVEQVSWDDVQAFIQALNAQTGKNYRLPTEAEWEYAARGGQKSKGFKYSGSSSLDNVGWYSGNSGNSGNKSHPVGQKRANELGLYDMSGNVYEWCSDWYAGDYYANSPGRNPKGSGTGSDRMFRGGSWINIAQGCRSAYRNYYRPGYRNRCIGFRLVCP